MASDLQLDGITKRFGSFTALASIDLQIAQGEFVCFLGPSGCGKTTLLRIIAGLETQSAGRILQSGRDISALPPALRDYGIVFQSYALFPNLGVADNVAYGLVNRRMPAAQIRTRVSELLALVGLPGSEARYPAQLSGGQQQRVALARALATAPGLLLLDEPLSALDATVRLHLRQEIRQLQRQLGVTTVMVTHDQEEALAVADRIVVMNHGVIEQVGTPLQVYREPASAFVADFIGRVNALPGRLDADGMLQLGALRYPHPGPQPQPPQAGPAGRDVTVYLRPEDVLASPLPADGSVAAGSFAARIEKIEFLGGYCLVQAVGVAPGSPRLSVTLAHQFLAGHGLQPGALLALQLRPERMRIFG